MYHVSRSVTKTVHMYCSQTDLSSPPPPPPPPSPLQMGRKPGSFNRWLITWSPKDATTDSDITPMKKFLDENTHRYIIVNELAKKDHMHIFFQSYASYNSSYKWPEPCEAMGWANTKEAPHQLEITCGQKVLGGFGYCIAGLESMPVSVKILAQKNITEDMMNEALDEFNKNQIKKRVRLDLEGIRVIPADKRTAAYASIMVHTGCSKEEAPAKLADHDYAVRNDEEQLGVFVKKFKRDKKYDDVPEHRT